MILLYRDDEYALKLEFDLKGASQLKKNLQIALELGEIIINLEKGSILEDNKTIDILKVTNAGEPSELYYKDKILTVELDKEIIEFCLERLNKCILGEEFFPAEICDVYYNDNELTLYGIFCK